MTNGKVKAPDQELLQVRDESGTLYEVTYSPLRHRQPPRKVPPVIMFAAKKPIPTSEHGIRIILSNRSTLYHLPTRSNARVPTANTINITTIPATETTQSIPDIINLLQRYS